MAQKLTNPWIDQYRLLNNDSIIRDTIRIAPAPLDTQELSNTNTAAGALKHRLAECYVPTQKDVNFIKLVLGKAEANAVTIYPNEDSFRRRIHQERVENEPAFPVLLCGLAGVGKSCLYRAVHRLLTSSSHRIQVSGFLGDWELNPYHAVSMKNILTLAEVLRTVLSNSGTPLNKRGLAGKQLHDAVARKLFREGCSLLGLDEFQFVSQGSSANARVTNILLGTTYLGVPFFYICNYSLVNRLLSRNEEDIHRLMSHVIVLEPDPPDSDDWSNLLNEYQRIGSVGLDFELSTNKVELWNMSAGIKRHVVNLLATGYQIARSDSRFKLTLADLTSAYKSTAFSVQRREIEALISQAVLRKCVRKDIWCPSIISSSADREYQNALKSTRQSQLAAAIEESALTPQEKIARAQHRETNSDRRAESHSAKTTGKRKVKSAEDLLSSAFEFDQLIKNT